VGDDNDNDNHNEHENTGIKLQGEGGSRPIGLLNPSAGLASSQPLVDPKVDQSPARIAAYPIDARGLLAREPSQSQQDEIDFDRVLRNGKSMPAQSLQPVGDDTMDMETLADETGGEAFVITNNITGAIRQAVEDSAATYTLGFISIALRSMESSMNLR